MRESRAGWGEIAGQTVRVLCRRTIVDNEKRRQAAENQRRGSAEGGADSSSQRSAADLDIAALPLRRGGILKALRRSPLVGADAIAERPFEPGRCKQM